MARHQIIHVDYMCNECCNCRTFCPWDSAPYQDKFTLFANVEDLKNSKNQGFVVTDKAQGLCRVRLQGQEVEHKLGSADSVVPADLDRVMATVLKDYSYLL